MKPLNERSEEPDAKPSVDRRCHHVRAGDDNLDSIASDHPISEAESLIDFSVKGKQKSTKEKTTKTASQ